jgi:hypothetical protein
MHSKVYRERERAFYCHADLLTDAGLVRMREITRCGRYAVSSFRFLRVAWQCSQSLVQYGACAPPDSKMGTEVVGTLTHADTPHRGHAPHRAHVPRAFITLYNRFTYEIILCGCYACESNPRAWPNLTAEKRNFVSFNLPLHVVEEIEKLCRHVN